MAGGFAIGWHSGPRAALRDLFEMAEDSPAQLDAYIDDGRVLVATDDAGAVVGHLQLIPVVSAEVMEIRSLAVREELRGRGLGRRLVAHALAAARAEGVRRLTVTTALADIGNLRFYQRCGFLATSIERDAFTPARGYPPDLRSDGIPVRDAIRFAIACAPGAGVELTSS